MAAQVPHDVHFSFTENFQVILMDTGCKPQGMLLHAQSRKGMKKAMDDFRYG